MRRLAAALVLLFLWACAVAETFDANVVAVIDGDTVTIRQAGRKATIRLAGIDAPENSQAFGRASRAALATLVLHRVVRVTPKAVDHYGRTVAIMQVGHINVNEEQLRLGLAWEYSHHHADKALIALQAEARRARRGLWADASALPPWEFRKVRAPARRTATAACGKKYYCSQMVSCEEAKFYLTQCRIKTLDKDADGVPCENLCDSQARLTGFFKYLFLKAI